MYLLVQQLQEQPEALSYRSCPAPTFPSILDTLLPFHGVSWVVLLCLREPVRVGTASSSTQFRALQLWGLPRSVGTSCRFGSCGRFFSAAQLAFTLPGCALTQCWALGSLPCLALCAAPVQAPAGTTGALRGARQVLSPPGALAWGVDQLLSGLRALPGAQAWHKLEPSCQSL